MASYAGYCISKSIETLNNYKRTITNKTEINRIKLRLNSEINAINKYIDELLAIISTDYGYVSRRDMNSLKRKVDLDLKAVESLTTTEQAIDIIDSYAEYKEIGFDRITNSEFCSLVSRLTINRFDLSEEFNITDCRTIMNAININRDFNVFSTRARRGDTIVNIKSLTDRVTAYGLEADDDLVKTVKERCDRAIKGVVTGSRISNDVFDMMYLIPQISWECSFTQIGGLAEKAEKAMLRNHIKHLRKGGIFIYCIPVFRLTRDMAMLISKLLDNVQVIRKDESSIKQIIIMGTKKITRDPKTEIYDYLNNLNYDNIGSQLENKYNLPSGGLKSPEFFRGSALDLDEINGLIKSSGLMESFIKQQEISKEDNNARPLLPFNMGQIGLVLTSGCLDGVVEEYEEQHHAIKGMVTKIRHTDTNSDAGNEESVLETISNKVQINIITPDGQFIELA